MRGNLIKKFIINSLIVLLVLTVVHSFFSPIDVESPVSTVIGTEVTDKGQSASNGEAYVRDSFYDEYDVTIISSESEALNLLKGGWVVSAVYRENSYIIKTKDDMFYQIPMTSDVELALNIAGVVPVYPTSSYYNNFGNFGSGEVSGGLFDSSLFYWILGILLSMLVINFIIKIYRERKMIEAAEHLAFNDVMQSGFGLKEKKEESKDDTMRIKKVTFDDVQGIDELKPDLLRLVDCLKNPEKYNALGARPPKGLILYGPPGTGKTLIAKALAGEAGVPFFHACGSDFMEKYVGVGAQRIRDLFKKARKSAPCIVFIDEIDAIGGGRGESNSGEKDQTINALLAELDGFKSSDNILTICATNRIDILDPALMRAGRFDLKLAVGLPDREGREAILGVHSKNKKLSPEVSIPGVAKQTVGFSGAELEALLNESALIAADNDKKEIDNEDIENAFFKIIMEGNKKKRKEDEVETTKLVAWHEAGHTIITKLLTNTGVPTVTIVGSTSGAGGVTFMSPEENKLSSKKDLRNEIKISYGGRAAEELYLGNTDDITTGASQDIKQATAVIKSYISNYGMGDKGLIDVKQLTSQYDILEEATKLSNDLYKETVDFLRENLDKLNALAEALLDKETLYEDDIDIILGLKTEEEVSLEKEKRKGLFEKAEKKEEVVETPADEDDTISDLSETNGKKDLGVITPKKYKKKIDDFIEVGKVDIKDEDDD